jgi:colanic acid/amylovoran biosynthesis protein
MKKIVITPGITDLNRGDQALIWLIKDILADEGVPVEAKLLQSGNNEEDIYMQSRQSVEMGYDVMTPLLLHPARNKETKDIGYSLFVKLRWGITALKDLVNSSLLLSKYRFLHRIGEAKLNKHQITTYQSFKDMDLMVVKGGGFLHTYKRITDIYYLYYSLFNIMLAHRLGKKVIIMPNSFGPFLGKFEKYIVKKVLNKCDLIYAREDISRRYLHDLLGREVFLSPDLGFYISPNENEDNLGDIKLPKSEIKVAITMRPYRFPEYSDGEHRYEKYINEMFLVCKELIKNGYHPVFVAHTLGPSAHEDDRIALNKVIEKLKEEGVSSANYTFADDPGMNCFGLTNLYSQVDYIIGTRFHSVIFAMTSFTPAIAISYSGHKTTGIMQDMGLEEYVVKIGEMDSKVLIEKFNKLVIESDKVKKKIQNYLVDCNKQKHHIVNEVKKVIEKVSIEGEL